MATVIVATDNQIDAVREAYKLIVRQLHTCNYTEKAALKNEMNRLYSWLVERGVSVA